MLGGADNPNGELPSYITGANNLAVAIEHYNENHPHSALGYRSPREYRRQRVMLT